jgi:hypothetical protein
MQLVRDVDQDEFAAMPSEEGAMGAIPPTPGGPAGPALPPLPPALPTVDPLAALKAEQDQAQNQKGTLGAIGAIGDILSNRNGFGNFFTGEMQPQNHAAKDFAGQLAANVQDPIDRQSKALAYLRSKKDADYTTALDDPKSPQSMALKQLYKDKFNIDSDATTPGADLLRLGDPKELMKEKVKSQIDFEKEKAIHAMDNDASIKKFLLEAAQHRRDKLDDKDSADSQKMSDALSKGWAARGGNAALVQSKLLAAERAEALLEQAKSQPGGLDSRQVEELAQSTSNLLGGGAQASARVSALVPHTFWGNTQSLQEYLTNHPTGLGQSDFTDRMAETIRREKELAQKQMQRYQAESLPGFDRLKKHNPDVYNQILAEKGLTPSMIEEARSGHFKDSSSGYVRVQAPNGSVKNIPQSEVAAAIKAGGKLLDSAVAGGG